jgi:hypothetical protein
MSSGAITNPPTTSDATMKIARSAKRRLSRKINATSPAIPMNRLFDQPPSSSPMFSPTRSPSPAAAAGTAASHQTVTLRSAARSTRCIAQPSFGVV